MAAPRDEHFQAFEILDDDAPMRGFRRVVRCQLRDCEQVMAHPSLGFEQPFDVRFAKAVVKTASHLVGTDRDVVFAFAEHDAISLLFHAAGDDGQGDGRSLLGRIASLAASRLSLLLGDVTLFDPHLYQFPSPELVQAYFVWRQDCHRQTFVDRSVHHCLLAGNRDPDEARAIARDFGDEEKQEILGQNQIDLAAVPPWQVHGTAVFWQAGVGDEEASLVIDTLLPSGPEYASYLQPFL